jgi:Flp pilus assembly protein TadD
MYPSGRTDAKAWGAPTLWVCGMLVCGVLLTGCGPTFYELRVEGQNEMAQGQWGTARQLFETAHRKRPDHLENLHDLGACSTMLAKRQVEQRNSPAARRELQRAVDYYSRAIAVAPAYQPAIMGKNRALELEGQFEEALRGAHWAARYVGPSADQYIYLGKEYEERGDLDAAFLRYRQAVAMEPRNPRTHKAIALLYQRAGNERGAIDAAMRSLRLDPTQQEVANMLRAMGEPVPAVEADVADY